MNYPISDSLAKWFGLTLMDELHDYPSPTSNIRYYHRLKARYVQHFLLQQRNTETFLDAGAGRGPYSILASPLFDQVYCDEFNSDELAHAKKTVTERNIDNITCVNGDLTATTYADNFFDCIVCSEVLEHIPNREQAVSELTRILKPGGRLLISMPQRHSLFYQRVLYKYKEFRGITDLPVTHPDWERFQHVKFTAAAIRLLCTSAGLKIVATGGVNVLPLNERFFKILYASPVAFYGYMTLESLLEKTIPFFGSFYFVELTKK